jgi:antitoxin component HigA of HigAB toxin-antitoxin module
MRLGYPLCFYWDRYEFQLAPDIEAGLRAEAAARGMDVDALIAAVSEVLSGKRSISKEKVKKLASLFKVAVDLFI